MALGLSGYSATSVIPPYQYASDENVLAARLTAIEVALGLPARRPSVGDWALDMDGSGQLVAINLRTNTSYLVTLGPGTPLPVS